VINIRDAYEDARFNREIDKHTGYRTKSMLVCPVKSKDGTVIGAIQMINKKDKETDTDISFVDGDLRMVQMLASHVSGFIRIVNA
jgi:hypothetical protein